MASELRRATTVGLPGERLVVVEELAGGSVVGECGEPGEGVGCFAGGVVGLAVGEAGVDLSGRCRIDEDVVLV
jgi:hypothetical protein